MQEYFLLGLISLDALRTHATFVMHAFDLETAEKSLARKVNTVRNADIYMNG